MGSDAKSKVFCSRFQGLNNKLSRAGGTSRGGGWGGRKGRGQADLGQSQKVNYEDG